MQPLHASGASATGLRCSPCMLWACSAAHRHISQYGHVVQVRGLPCRQGRETTEDEPGPNAPNPNPKHGYALSRVNLLVSYSARAEFVWRYRLEATNTVNQVRSPDRIRVKKNMYSVKLKPKMRNANLTLTLTLRLSTTPDTAPLPCTAATLPYTQQPLMSPSYDKIANSNPNSSNDHTA